MVAYRRIYIGSAAVGITLLSFFIFINSLGAIIVSDGDIYCAGNSEDPCVSFINITVPVTFYIYNKEGIDLSFSKDIKDYDLYIRDKRYTRTCIKDICGWRPFDLTEKKDGFEYVYKFYPNKVYELALFGYKNNPSDDIKWTIDASGGSLDPYWYGPQGYAYLNQLTGEHELYYEQGTVRIKNYSYPEVILGKWNEEAWIKVSVPESFVKGEESYKLTWKNSEKEVKVYWLDDEKFEFEVILNEKPTSNIISLDIDSYNLDFFYQPALNSFGEENCNQTDCWDEFNEIVTHMPENSVGSYAVYHKTKMNNKYKTGKAFHIYRPRAVDNDGWEVWGELNIENDKLNVTLPQYFIDNAAYPIYHATGLTFGYTSRGTVSQTIENVIVGSNFTLPDDGTINNISFWGDVSGGGKDAVAGIYDSSLNLEGYTNPVALGDDALITLTFTLDPEVSSGEKYLVGNSESATGVGLMFCDVFTSYGREKAYSYTATLPATLTSPSTTNYKFSIYSGYTAGGAPGDPDINWSSNIGALLFLNCSPDWEFYPTSPDGQTVTLSALNATNNGTATGDFQIEYIGSLNAGWTLFACNDDSETDPDNDADCITMSDSFQTIWSTVLVNQNKSIWLYGNCSNVSANPGVSIDMQVV